VHLVTLVHGTWAPNPEWTLEASPLCQSLKTLLGDVVFERFTWSGKNSHHARSKAAECLQEHIRRCASLYAERSHILIAHSHGGNVCLYALRAPDIDAAIQGVICLSTPFILCRDRGMADKLLAPTMLLYIAGVVAIKEAFSSHSLRLSALAIVLLALLVIGHGVAGWLLRARLLSPASYKLASLRPDRLLVVRAAGDEASAALGTAYGLSVSLRCRRTIL
jgi:hypothetical protein